MTKPTGVPRAEVPPAASVREQSWLAHGVPLGRTESPLPGGLVRERTLLKAVSPVPFVLVDRTVRREPGAPAQETVLREERMVADRLLVKPTAGLADAAFADGLRRLGATKVAALADSAYRLVEFAAASPDVLGKMLDKLRAAPSLVAHVEPDFIVHASVTPNDTRFSEQWSLHNTGQNGGTVDADIDAPEAWALTTGSNSVIVAVVDTGVDYNHPDLAANIWTNSGEVAGDGIDNDGNGYVDDVRGWNFVSSNNNVTDDNSHGTHVAGTIGAVGDNGAGVSGVAWSVKLMPVKFLDAYGYGTTSNAVLAINYARVKGATFMNHSWGDDSFSQALKDAVDAAGADGIIQFAACGNGSGVNTDTTPDYPSSFASAGIVSVASTDALDALSGFSNYGPGTVHVAAPGSSILSTVLSSGYGLKSGTSMATPHVAGIAALLKAQKPTLTGADIKALLQSSVDVLPSLTGRTVSGGRVNAFRALDFSSDISVVASSGVDFTGNSGGPFTPTSRIYTLKNHGAASASWTAVLNNMPWATVSPSSGTLAAGGTLTLTVSLNAAANSAVPGLNEGTLTVANTTSGKSTTWPVRLDVTVPYLYSFDLSADPGWLREAGWQFGTPTGHGGANGGNPDPTSAHTGTNVFGVNLNGDYPAVADGTHSLVLGPFDLRGCTQTKLDFWRWLNSRSNGVYHAIEARTSPTNAWSTLWSDSSYTPVTDSAWTQQTLNLGALGDNQAQVWLRFTYTVLDASLTPSSSWNVDDIRILGKPGKRVFLDGPASASENAGTAALTLHVEPPSATALTVTLASSDTTAATVPATVNVPAGTAAVAVTATLVNDALRDGPQTALLTPVVTGYSSIPWSLTVTDDETATLGLSMPATATEGATVTGTVTVSPAPERDMSITLVSDQPAVASVPATVMVPAGQGSATFSIALPQNSLLEGTKNVHLTASATGWAGAAADIAVADDEGTALTLTFPRAAAPYHLAEGMDTSSYAATVSLSGPRLVDTVVTLTRDDTTEFSLPATVTIPAGQRSATITPITVVDDALQDGVQTVLVTASAPGLVNGTESVTVADNEAVSFAFDYIPSPQAQGSYTYATVTARDVNGALAAGYTGSATVTALNGGSPDAAFGSTTASFLSGIAVSVYAAFPTRSTNYQLKATAGSLTGTSNTFTVDYPSARSIAVTANEIAYDPGTNRLYASTSAGTIVPINPDTAAAETPITVSTGSVGQIEISPTGSVLYAVVNSGTQIVRVDLVARTVGTPFSVGTDGIGFALTVADLAVLPNDSNTIGVVLNQGYSLSDRVAVYSNGVRRPTAITYNAYASNNPVAATQITAGSQADRFYASTGSNGYTTNTLYLLDVNANGVQLARSYDVAGTLGNLSGNGSLLAVDSGQIFDAETGNLRGKIGTTGTGEQGAALVDEATGRAWAITHRTLYYADPYDLRVYETTGFSETGMTAAGAQPLAGAYYPYPPTRIVKVGTQGVAYRTSSSVVLVRSRLLQDAAAPAPDLAVQQILAPDYPVAGKPVSFNMLVRNNGNAAAASVVLTSEWTNDWAGSASFISASTTKGTFTTSLGRLSVNLGTLNAGEAATVCLVVSGANTLQSARVSTSTTEPLTLNNAVQREIVLQSNPPQFSYIPLLHTDLASSRTTQRVYASVGQGAGFFAGTLAVFDPATPALRAFVPVGSSPGALAMAEDQTSLTIAMDGDGLVRPFDTGTLTAGTAFETGTATDGRRLFANDIVARTGNAGQVIVARRDALGGAAGVVLFGNGSPIGSAIPSTVPVQWLAMGADGATCFGHGGSTLCRFDVSSGGVSVAATRTGVSLGKRLGFGGNRVLTATSRMLNPTTLADAGFLDGSSSGDARILCAEPERERIYLLNGSSGNVLTAYDTLSLQAVAQVAGNSNYDSPNRMVRWGAQGLAYSKTNYGSITGIAWIQPTALVPDLPLHVNFASYVMENAGTAVAAGTVQLTLPATQDLTVTLASSNPALVQAPPSVTILAGQTSASFSVTVTNDALLNGARTVTITPGGVSGYALLPGLLEVRDDETSTLALTVPATVSEGAGAITGQASVSLGNGPAGADIIVQLTSSDTTELTVPATVTIPAGQSSVAFTVTAPDDDYVDGAKPVTVTATVNGWANATGTVAVQDNEPATINLGLPASVTEGDGSYSPVLLLAGSVESDTVVTLTSSNPDKLSVPSTVTVQAGTFGRQFSADIGNDTLKDGRHTVTITASSSGFATASQNVIVKDNDLGAVVWSTVPDGTAGVFSVTVTGKTIDGDPANLPYYATVPASATRGGVAVPGASGTISSTLGSAATGSVRITQAGTGTVLSATFDGVTGSSNAFSVLAGPMNAFTWDAITGSPQPGAPFPVTIRASDGYGNPVTGFTGTATLSAAGNAELKTLGTGDSVMGTGMDTSQDQARVAMFFTAAELGRAGRLNGLALELQTPPGRPFDSFTVRLKHSSLSYLDNAWDNTGWTTVRTGALNLMQTKGWVEIPFTTSFDYNGTAPLLVEFFFSNTGTAVAGGALVADSTHYGDAVGATANASYSYGTPENWSGYSPYASSLNRPVVRLRFGTAVTLTPAVTGSFVNGVWTGNATIPQAASDVILTAVSGVAVGNSASFEVGAVPPAAPVMTAEPAFTATTSNTVSWSAVSGATGYYVEVATANTFATPLTNSGWITGTSQTFTGLPDGMHLYYRVKARKNALEGPWSNIVDSTQDASGPIITLGNGDSGTTTAFSTLRSPWTVSGTVRDAASGLSALQIISGSTVYNWSYNADGTWSATLNGLAVGNTYSLGFRAYDNLGNMTLRNVTIMRDSDADGDGLPDTWETNNSLSAASSSGLNGATGDPDLDLRPNLMEYAFNTGVNSGNGNALPAMARAVNPADGLDYLTFTYDRRRGAVDLFYTLEFSTNLTTWAAGTYQTEIVGAPTPNADGVTERVTLRILPDAAHLPGRVFARMNVRLAQ